jgi:ElaB/YqjD/DUF883 family membrane-anchored ribosome-binding protein
VTNAEIEALERDVEQARGRLVVDLARLRSAGNLAELKQDISAEVSETKDRLVGRAKDAARQRSQSVLDGIRARVAANPGAALAIGAGLAWRLYRHPPIASLLVGAGLVGLFRTDPEHPAMGSDAAARAVEFAGTARDRLDEWRHSDTAGQIGEAAAIARERAAEFAATASERVGEAAVTAREQATEFAATASRRAGEIAGQATELADAARRRLGEWNAEAGDTAGQVASQAGAWTRSGTRVASRAMEDRDKYLLGAAGLALAAAIGIAYQRRSTEETAPPER